MATTQAPGGGTAAPTPQPAPQGGAAQVVMGAIDQASFFFWALVVVLFGPQLVALLKSGGALAGRTASTIYENGMAALGHRSAKWVQVLVVPVLLLIFITEKLFDYIRDRPWSAPLSVPEIMAADAHVSLSFTIAMGIVVAVGALQLVLYFADYPQHVSITVVVLAVVASGLMMSGTLGYYALVVGDYAVSRFSIIEMAWYMREAMLLWFIAAIISFVSLELLRYGLVFVGGLLRQIIPIFESVLGAFAGIAASSLPAFLLSGLRQFVRWGNTLINEDRVEGFFSGLVTQIRSMTIPLQMIVLLRPTSDAFFISLLAGGAIGLVSRWAADASAHNRAVLAARWEKFTMIALTCFTVVVLAWVLPLWAKPQLIVGIVDGVGWLWSQPTYLVCVMKGLATSVAWLKYILAVLGAVVAFLVLLSLKNAKDAKGVSWRVATALLGIPLLSGAAFLILGTVIATESMETLACKGCGLPSISAVAISPVPSAPMKEEPKIRRSPAAAAPTYTPGAEDAASAIRAIEKRQAAKNR